MPKSIQPSQECIQHTASLYLSSNNACCMRMLVSIVLRATLIFPLCLQIGHTAKNKACPMYGRTADDMEEDLFESPVRRTTKSRLVTNFGCSNKFS